MTDVYTEDTDDFEAQLGALDRLRADVKRLAHHLEHRVQASASDVLDETRMLAQRTQHRINSQLGTAALIALCGGIALGLLAAALTTRRSSRRR